MGDRACWLAEVCDACGRLIDAPDAHATACPRATAEKRTRAGGGNEVPADVAPEA